MKKFTNKFVAAVASLAMAGTLCVAGAVTVSSVAWASGPKVVPQSPAASKGPKVPWEKDAPATGTLTILKCKKKDASTAAAAASPTSSATSTDSCSTNYEPLSGATFTVTKVTKIGTDEADFTKHETWLKIAKILTKLNNHTVKESGDGADITLGTTTSGTDQNVFTKTTSADGKATFTDLKVGLYKVEETGVPQNFDAVGSKSFYMTMPLPEVKNEISSGRAKITTIYNYSPTVKPKNVDISSFITKTYDKKKFASAKDKIPYTITSTVNKEKIGDTNLTADDLKGYKVFDDAPTAAFGTIDENVVKHVRIGTGDNSELTKGANQDYTVSVTPNADTTEVTTVGDTQKLAAVHTRILVTFTDTGLGKIASALNNVQKGQEVPKVTVDLEFELSDTYKNTKAPTGTDSVAADKQSQDEVVNKSGFFPAHSATDGNSNPIIPGKKADSTIDFGFLQVHKFYMKNGEKENLQGAEFKIFADKKNAEDCSQGLKENKALDSITACSAASKFENATTNDQGNTSAYKTRAGEAVYVLEVKSPDGYAPMYNVQEVTVEKDKTKTLEFENFPLKGGDDGNKFWFNLPATGAYGVLIFAVVGMVLIVASVIMYVRNRKEEEQQQNA